MKKRPVRKSGGKQLNVEISHDLHALLKERAARLRKPMNAVMVELLKKYLKGNSA